MASFDLAGKRIYVAGHGGMVGGALLRRLEREGCIPITATRHALDLTRQSEVESWFAVNRPDVVFLAAARVGGIHANNTRPVDFLRDNLLIETNIIDAAHRHGVQKLIFLGSSCIYPKQAAQPIIEDALLSGPLEPTNEWYAIAKIAGIKLCQAYRRQYGCDFIAVQPTNLYGPGDNFDLASSHVLPALLVKAMAAQANGEPAMPIWGSGTPQREFMHVDDLADALVFLAKNYSDAAPINVGSGQEVTIRQLAEMIAARVGFTGALTFDASKPDGTPRKRIDSSRLNALGWSASIALDDGIASTFAWYQSQIEAGTDIRGLA
ncbi:MAG: GDP-L-fucose synthase [Sphingopyxis sp.]